MELTAKETQWDRFVAARGGHLLQLSRWGKLKAAFGWDDEIVTISDDGSLRAGALILYRRLPLGVGTIAYVPRGPVVDWDDQETVTRLMDALHKAAKSRRAMLLKFEPNDDDSEEMQRQLESLGFRPSPQSVQPPRSAMMDISEDEDSILAGMNQGTRRKIRQSAKKGVEIREGDAGDIETFSTLMNTTGSRNAFGVHSLDYYRLAYDLFRPEYVALLMASYEGKILGGLMVFAVGETAWYIYGGSSNEERNRMPNYGLQWAAIQWAKQHGCTQYDLWGVPDEDEPTLEAQFKDRSDGLWGVYGFKRGFGGEITRTAGVWDSVYNPLLYAGYKFMMERRGG